MKFDILETIDELESFGVKEVEILPVSLLVEFPVNTPNLHYYEYFIHQDVIRY